MKRDYKLFLNDISESIALIERYMSGVSEEKFIKEIDIQDKVIRRIEIIGEAISNLPRIIKEKNPNNLWEEFGEFRNFIVHHYYEASLSRIYGLIKNKMPLLKQIIQNIKLV
jgi:uncharacterized protein with HEPN domain